MGSHWRIGDLCIIVEHKALEPTLICPLTGREKYLPDRDKDLLVVRPVKGCFWEAVSCQTYRPADKPSHYNEKIAGSLANWARRLVQMTSQEFDSFEPITIRSILSAF